MSLSNDSHNNNNKTYIYSSISANKNGLLDIDPTKLQYHSGFGNTIISESLINTIPIGQNNPQQCNYGLYAEQLSGTSFTTPKAKNRRSWLYRILPTCLHKPYKPIDYNNNKIISNTFHNYTTSSITTPNQIRWLPLEVPTKPTTFLQGLHTVAHTGNPATKQGLSIHLYSFNASMLKHNLAHVNSDGDYLIVPQQNNIIIRTEFGILYVKPKEIAVIQRGMVFSVCSENNNDARGYICEVYDGHFECM